MGNARRFCCAVGAVAVLAAMVPGGASALTIPGIPPGTIPPGTIPPEVDAALTDALAQSLTTLATLDLTGLGVAKASSSPGSSTASAIDLPGVLTLGKSQTTKNSSKVEVLSVLGTNLWTKEGNATGGTNTGPAAAVGDLVDSLNSSLCPSLGSPGTECVALLYSKASDTSSTSTTTRPGAGGTTTTTTINNDVHQANFKLVKVKLSAAPEGLELLPTSATSAKTSGTIVVKRGAITLTTIPFGPLCTDVATAFIATGSGQLALVSLVGLNNAIKVGGIAKPC